MSDIRLFVSDSVLGRLALDFADLTSGGVGGSGSEKKLGSGNFSVKSDADLHTPPGKGKRFSEVRNPAESESGGVGGSGSDRPPDLPTPP